MSAKIFDQGKQLALAGPRSSLRCCGVPEQGRHLQQKPH
jgi:hypothetical protein